VAVAFCIDWLNKKTRRTTMDEMERYNEIYERMATEERAAWLPLLNRIKLACRRADQWAWDIGQFMDHTGMRLGADEWRVLANIFTNDIRVTMRWDLNLFEITNKTRNRR